MQAYGSFIDEFGLIRPVFEPSAVSVVSEYSGVLGACLVRYPIENTLGLYTQSKDGSIRKVDFNFQRDLSMEQDDGGQIVAVEWSDEMKALDEAAKKRASSPDIDPIALRDYTEVDFSSYYKGNLFTLVECIFINQAIDLYHRMYNRKHEQNADAILNTIEMMPEFQQRMEGDEDDMLTT